MRGRDDAGKARPLEEVRSMEKEWRKEIEEEVRRAAQVIIRDLSNYDWRRCHNGGCYAFTTHYERISKDKWAVWYGTSSEFGYCSVFGEFRECEDCPFWNKEEEECEAEVETVSTQEVIAAVVEAYDSDEVEVEIKGEFKEAN